MLEFIKMFGLGVLYTLLFPLIVVIFLLYTIYVFCNYLVLEVINLVGFFFGYSFSTETELERRLHSGKRKESSKENTTTFEETIVFESNGTEVKGSDVNE